MRTNNCSFHINAETKDLIKWTDTIAEPVFDRDKTYDEISVPTEDSLK